MDEATSSNEMTVKLAPGYKKKQQQQYNRKGK
jgi:hypothetical protein